MLVAQVDDSYDSHNSLQHLASDFIGGQSNKHADFPISLSSLLIAPSPAWKMERGHGIGMSNQPKEPLGDTFTRGIEGIWYCRLQKRRSSQSAHHTVHNTSHTVILYIVVKYTCLPYIRIHYLKPLSDGSKKSNERTIGT